MASPNSVLPPQSDKEQDSYYNPGETKYREGMGAGYVGSGVDQAEAFANDPKNKDNTDAVRNAEENPDESLTGGLYNPTPGGGGFKQKQKFDIKALIKKRGALGAIITIVLGGGGFAILSAPTLLLFHIQEMFVDKFDSQNTSYTIRQNKVLGNKLSKETTNGSCNVVQIACRFTRPSNSFLKNMEKNGIRALDASGSVIEKNGLFPNARPASYEFTNSSGVTRNIKAVDFAREAISDPTLRAAFHRAYNPRFTSFTDSVFASIQKRFDFKKTNSLANTNNLEEVERNLADASRGNDVGARAASEAGEEASESLLKKLLLQYGTKAAETISKSGKGGGISLAMGGVCAATNVPGMVIGVSRAYQMTQLIKFSATFLAAASAIKAGSDDVTPGSVSALGSMLTETTDGKSAMDSFGMKYALFDDTSPEPKDNYSSFAPGAAAIVALGGLKQVVGGPIAKDTCDVALNPVTSATINASLVAAGGATLGTTALAAGVNLAAGAAIGALIGVLAPPVISAVIDLLQPQINSMIGLLLGDLTANLDPMSTGNALSSGASHMMGQVANAGGNMPLSVEQAVAYNDKTKEVQLAYAEEDRATLSPFDATNQNTFLGQIVNNFVPYYAQLGSLSGVIKTISSVPALSFASIFKSSSASATSTAAQYELCPDPALETSSGKVAAGPYCNIEYGIPVQYLDMDPEAVVNALVESGDIDPNSGKPKDTGQSNDDVGITGLKQWVELCSDGTADQAVNCQIKDQKTALYAVYTIDHRVLRSLDGMDEESAQTTATTNVVLPLSPGFRISDDFGPRTSPCSGCSSWHKGMDFTGGDKVIHSIQDGTVISIGGVNNTVAIQHADGLISQYLHMYPGTEVVKVGDTVTAGQVIGTMGSYGQSTGTHLHFELKIQSVSDPSIYAEYTKDNTGTFINPAEYFAKNGLSV